MSPVFVLAVWTAASGAPAPAAVGPAPRSFAVDAPAERRTLPRYFGNAARNVADLWSHQSLVPLLAGAAGTGAASLFDDEAMRYFERNPMRDLGRAGGRSGSAAVVAGGSLALMALSQTAGGDRFRAAAYDTSQAVLVNALHTFALKSTTQRWRPDGSNRMSFPSGHTSNAFAVATVWSEHYGTRAAVPGYVLASMVGVSRLASKRHHLSDVVAGATLGYLVGKSAVRVNGGRPDALRNRARLALAPLAGPSGDGVGVSLSLNLSPRR